MQLKEYEIHCQSYPMNEDAVDLNRGIGNGYFKLLSNLNLSRTLLIIPLLCSLLDLLCLWVFVLFGTP